MRTVSLIPLRDESGGIHVQGGNLEMYFPTVDDLKIKLWRARIDPTLYKRQLIDLQNGFRASVSITEAQWKAFLRA